MKTVEDRSVSEGSVFSSITEQIFEGYLSPNQANCRNEERYIQTPSVSPATPYSPASPSSPSSPASWDGD